MENLLCEGAKTEPRDLTEKADIDNLIDEDPVYTEFVLYERFSARLMVANHQPFPFFYARAPLLLR